MKSHIKRIVKDIDYGNSVVKLHLKTDGMLKVGMSTSFALIFLFLGLFFWINFKVATSGLLFIGLSIFLVGIIFRTRFYEWVEFDQTEQTMKYCSARLGSRITKAVETPQSSSFQDNRIYWYAEELRKTITIRIVSARKVFWFVVPTDQHNRLMNWYSSVYIGPEPELVPDLLDQEINQSEQSVELAPPERSADSIGHATMLNEIASWGRSSLILGVVHIIASGFLNPGWGVTLLAVGGLSFIFKEASMFIMYAVTLIWVGISNIMSLDVGLWTFFGAYQIYLGVMLFKKYRRYRDYELQHLNSLEEIPADYKVGRAPKLFPWAGGLLSGLGLVVYVGVWLAVFVALVVAYDESQAASTLSDSVWNIFDLVGGVALGLGIVGLGLSISSVASKYKPKFVAWAGVVLGSLLVLAEVAIKLWIIFGQ